MKKILSLIFIIFICLALSMTGGYLIYRSLSSGHTGQSMSGILDASLFWKSELSNKEQTTAISSSKDMSADAFVHPQPSVTYLPNAWEHLYEGGMSIDRDVAFVGPESLRVTATKKNIWYGATQEFAAIDMTDKIFRLAVKVSDWNDLGVFLLLVSTGDTGNENYFTFNFRDHFMNPEKNEWQEVVLAKSDFEASVGTPDWSEVKKIMFRVSTNSGHPVVVHIDELRVVENKTQSVVTLAFDDGYNDVFIHAYPKMQTYGYAGTNFVIPEFIGTEGYQTERNLVELSRSGWDISGHSSLNLRHISENDAKEEIMKVHAWLAERMFDGRRLYAYPNGSYNQSVQKIVGKYFMYARTIDGLHQPRNAIVPNKINAKTVSRTTSISEIKQWINESATEGTWLIITWHQLKADPVNDIDYSIVGFNEIIDYLNTQKTHVLPMSAVLP